MATVTRENIGLLHEKLTLTVTPADYTRAYNKALIKVSETANIHGFRKGKVPLSVVNKMYGEKLISEEIFKIVDKEISGFITKEKLDIITQPMPLSSTFNNIDVNNLKEYEFVFEIGLKPEINIDPKDIKVTRYVIEIPDKMIDDQAEKIQLQLGTMSEPETVSSDDDLLNILLTEADANGEIIDGGLERSTSVNLKHFDPEFKKTLLGLKKDAFVTATLAAAFSEQERGYVLEDLGLDKEDASNAEKTFKIEITKIGHQEKSALDEEFFKKAYPNKDIKNEAEFRDAVRAEIEIYFKEQSRKQTHDQMYHYLLDNLEVPLPKGYLLRLLEEGESKDKPRTKEEALEVYPDFANQIKWSYITQYFQKAENIGVYPEDLKLAAKNQLFQHLGGQMQMFGDDNKFVDDYAERMAKDKKFIDEHYNGILINKIFTGLESKVTATEEGIDVETFGSKVHHHHF